MYYQNPLTVYDNKGTALDFYLADPFVLKYCGSYYCYNTSKSGVTVLVSEDLLHFEYLGYALQIEGEHEFWAPCVVYDNGYFYMYYASRNSNETDPHKQRLKVATAKCPEGPFVYQATLKDTFCIDADVQVCHGEKWKIFYATNDFRADATDRAGTSVAEDTLDNPFTLTGNPREVIAPTSDREIFCRNRFGDGRDWHTVEAPCFFQTGGKEYLMYSGNAYTSRDYFIDYAVWANGQWQKRDILSDPFVSGTDKCMGTGHNSVIKGPNLLEDWIVFHGMRRLPSFDGEETRELCIGKLLASDTGLHLLNAVSDVCDRPAAPYLHCFTRNTKDTNLLGWEKTGDYWQLDSHGFLQASASAEAMLYTQEAFSNCIFEVSLKAVTTTANTAYGVLISYTDDQHNAQVLLKPGEQTLQLRLMDDGNITLQEYPLPDLDFMSLHTITVKRSPSEAHIFLDNQQIGRLDGLVKKGKVGFTNHCAQAVFAGFTLTDCSR